MGKPQGRGSSANCRACPRRSFTGKPASLQLLGHLRLAHGTTPVHRIFGRSKLKVVPSASELCTASVPPCAATIVATIGNPSPVPP